MVWIDAESVHCHAAHEEIDHSSGGVPGIESIHVDPNRLAGIDAQILNRDLKSLRWCCRGGRGKPPPEALIER
jgi:hypothetical protein